MDEMGAKDKNLSGVVSISREEPHQHITIKNKAGRWGDYKTKGMKVHITSKVL
jgi:hypothetical protein